ncbi:MAG: LamB/YcsF family protein [Deltaproteobacteria bacterium]|nr:MAG: LamB/YcsF family protein [Deltaproteobacteria bacterium]TNF26682.1 MAG: LamB/YcsF family protein [Deltaproteobacteria bacterium]
MKLNADLGEGQHWDNRNIAHTLAPYIEIANISCNQHAGDEDHIKETIEICLNHGVAIGAHPSYEDRKNFGRISHTLSKEELRAILLRQWDWLSKLVSSFGGELTYFKAHGALYNDMTSNPEIFSVVQETIDEISKDLIHICSPFSSTKSEKVLKEGFIDRLYLPNGRLTPRSRPNAVHDDIDKVLQQIQSLKKNKVLTEDGSEIQLFVETLCLHGDNELLVENIRLIKETINEN